MIITRTPYRMSFFGGGTDYPAWYEKHGGSVLSVTLDRYCYILMRRMPPYLGTRYRIFYAASETVDRVQDIKHPAVRGCLQYLGIDDDIEINHAGDLPARSGLGSSSAFTVGLLNALHALNGRKLSRSELARQAIEVEQKVLRETVGVQDQICCASGGLNVIEIDRTGDYALRPVPVTLERKAALRSHLLLYFTGLVRNASEIAAKQVENMAKSEAPLKALASMVPTAMRILTGSGSLDAFGELLHDAWLMKRELSPAVSNDTVNDIYARAIKAGALGGKLLGAGGGGFMLLFARPKDHPLIKHALHGFHEVPVRFEDKGTHLIHED